MKRSIILFIFVLLISGAYIAGTGTTALKGKTQNCNSTLLVHSAPNTTGAIYVGAISWPITIDNKGNHLETHLCAGYYTVCVDEQGYVQLNIDGEDTGYEVTVNNGYPCPY
jgi:hypothetical protein